jgi:phosphohistidine phosphatase
MKKLVLIRHAKSSWENEAQADFERPLNKRGKNDAPFMGEIIKNTIGTPQLIISSPAKRALSTAKKMAKKLNYQKDDIKTDLKIYHAEDTELIRIIKKISEKYDFVAIVGHNPAITEVANILGDSQIINVPTSGAVYIEFELDSWENIKIKSGHMVAFEYPKKYPSID